MSAEPIALYGHRLRAAAAGSAEPLSLRYADGSSTPIDIRRWVADSDAADDAVLARVDGAVLDIGCGPGRMTEALGLLGARVLGIDIAADAVAMTHRRGALALHRSIFERIPATGRWGTALLIDGNIGIGGNPRALLDRVHELLARGGRVLLEAGDVDSVSRRSRVRLETAAHHSLWFPWATLSIADVAPLAAATAYDIAEVWTEDRRWFADLRAH